VTGIEFQDAENRKTSYHRRLLPCYGTRSGARRRIFATNTDTENFLGRLASLLHTSVMTWGRHVQSLSFINSC